MWTGLLGFDAKITVLSVLLCASEGSSSLQPHGSRGHCLLGAKSSQSNSSLKQTAHDIIRGGPWWEE